MKLSSTGRACALAFLTAFVTLFTQILVHRIISAKLLNNFAFLVISLTMLGFGVSGVILSRALGRLLERLEDSLAVCASLFALSLLGSTAAFCQAEIVMTSVGRAAFVRSLLGMMPYALAFALPFMFAGLILGILLTAPRWPAAKVYFADLLGSALGAFAVVPAIGSLGVEAGLVAAAAAQLGGTCLLATPVRRTARGVCVVGVLGLAAAACAPQRIFDFRYPPGTMLADMREWPKPFGSEHIAWDPVARIEVSRIPPPDPDTLGYPCLIGRNTGFHRRILRLLTQNNYAFTTALAYDGRPESLRGIEETIYAAAYQARSVERPKVLVVGVGGGFDILTALAFDAREVTGLEINSATLGILTRSYRDYFRPWVDDPRVRLIGAEGRHYLASHDDTYDVLQLSGVDSYSGTPGAAHVFSENYLYTAEAFDLYLSRLSPRGILNVMRLEYVPPREMMRVLTTAVAALRRAGVADPAAHVVTLTSREQNFVALLAKRTPFEPQELARLTTWAGAGDLFAVSAAPGIRTSSLYSAYLALGDPGAEERAISEVPFDVSPATDDRPFFFKGSFWWHLLPGAGQLSVRSSTPVMELSLLLLLGVCGLAAVITVVLPLRLLPGRPSPDTATWRYGLYFAAIALGYMAVEVALLQKFGLFLGHPNYALSVVLAALLFFTGIGSLLAPRLMRAAREPRFVAYAVAATVVAEYLLAFPRLRDWIRLGFGARVLIVCLLVAPIGIGLGTFMPTALERLKAHARDHAPWAWGVNGTFSVLAPILSVALSMTFGINALLLAALPVYVLGTLALPSAPDPR